MRNGSIAFFRDKVLGVLALPYENIGLYDVYERPISIRVFSNSTNYSKVLTKDEFVIVYDNNSYYSLMYFLRIYALRLTNILRTIDVNIYNQRTPRFIRACENTKLSIFNAQQQIDNFEDKIYLYDKTSPLDGFEVHLAPAPIVFDKLQEQYEKLWNDMLSYIGIPNLSINKKERLITDEVRQTVGGTMVSKQDRMTPRVDGFKKVNEMFGTNIKVSYYAFSEEKLNGNLYNTSENNM